MKRRTFLKSAGLLGAGAVIAEKLPAPAPVSAKMLEQYQATEKIAARGEAALEDGRKMIAEGERCQALGDLWIDPKDPRFQDWLAEMYQQLQEMGFTEHRSRFE